MFSGIVKSIGTIKEIREKRGGRECSIDPNLSYGWRVGESVLVSGVCSTITAVEKGTLVFFYMPETLKKTTISAWGKGDKMNIEPSLRVGDSISGHFVFGHIGGKGVIERIEYEGDSKTFFLKAPKELSRYLIPKGSVALDGVSLTLVEAKGNGFSVSLIPFTLQHTTLGLQKVGGEVNIEVDMLAKYLEKLVSASK